MLTYANYKKNGNKQLKTQTNEKEKKQKVEPYRIVMTRFIGDNTHFTYEITFNKSLVHTGKYSAIEKALNSYDKKEPKRWRAIKGGVYYSFTSNFKAEDYIEINGYFNNEDYNSGNYFKTREDAQEAADKLNK